MTVPEDLQLRLAASIAATPAPVLQHIVEVSRKAGSDAFKNKHYAEAVKLYSQALAGSPQDAILWRNRSAAHSALGEHQEALQDALHALQLNSTWPKGFYRLGTVYMDICEWKSAADAFQQGLAQDPSNRELAQKAREAASEADYEAKCWQAQLATERRGLVVDLRKARREEVRGTMERQYRQSMTAPDWELEDYDWRPTFLPGSKLKPAKPSAGRGPTRAALKGFIATLADLAHPKAALALLHDNARLGAYEDAIQASLDEQPGAHILVLGQGTGVLGLLAARAGAGRVSCFERSRMLYRMAKKALKANAAVDWSVNIHLYDRRLQAAGVQGEALPADVERALEQLRADAARQAQSRAGSSSPQETLENRFREGAQRATPDAPDGKADSVQNSALGTAEEGTVTSTAAPRGELTNRKVESAQGSTLAAAEIEFKIGIAVPGGTECKGEEKSLSPRLQPSQERLTPLERTFEEQGASPSSSLLSSQEGFPQASETHSSSGITGSAANGISKARCREGDTEKTMLGGEQTLPETAASPEQAAVGQGITTELPCSLPFEQENCEEKEAELAAMRARILADAATLPERAEILVTDLFDHSCLGLGLLKSLDYAAARLLKPGSRVVPAALKVIGMLVEMRITTVSGFDLSCLNRYRWHPHHEQIDLSRVPHRRLSVPFEALTLDLQGRADSITFKRQDSDSGAKSRGVWERQRCLVVPVTAAGVCNAVVFWFEVNLHGSSWISTWAGGRGGLSAAASWQQAAQYLDEFPVEKGGKVDVLVRQDMAQIHFSSPQAGKGRPRHAYIPRWHFDMVLDAQRNDAYEAAILRAVEFQRGMGVKELHVLDIGAGSGLLSMMAARAGADKVTGAEISQHMCDLAAETVVMNGFVRQCLMVNKDVRRMDAAAKPDGSPPDLERKADICVYEVFDSGLIGEGVLHLLHWAHARLLQPHATLVPMAAVVWCQPLQMRIERVKGLDMRQANRWQWRPDYQGIELAHCREQWKALGPPMEVLAFDFYEAEANMQPLTIPFSAAINAAGVCNAVACWFDLQLDESSQLSSSPYADKGTTWQQAVQLLPETAVVPNAPLRLIVKHDSYGISFALDEGMDPAASARGNDTETLAEMPLKDPVWAEVFERTAAFNGQVAKACIQNPLEYRSVAMAAVDFAARSHDHDIDPVQASEFCIRMMS